MIDLPSCQPVLERAVTPIDVLADQAYDTGVLVGREAATEEARTILQGALDDLAGTR